MKMTVEIEVPDWANWMAQDCDGEWVFHHRKPTANRVKGVWSPEEPWDLFDTAYWGRPSKNWTQELYEIVR